MPTLINKKNKKVVTLVPKRKNKEIIKPSEKRKLA